MFQPTEKVRHSGKDAGIQPQGCQTMPDTASCNALVLPGTNHPGRYDSAG
ncbi:MAG: hypothetical protein PHO08_05520 [Methylococcales bacterium]|nr:hypothetical protein [Methylococcales bacterium]